MKQKSELPGIAIQYFNAWTNKDFERATALIAETAKFDMPINNYGSRAEFMGAVQFTANAVSSITLHAIFESVDQAMMLYDIVLPDVGPMRIAEYFKIKGEHITEIWHVHDTHQLRSTVFNKE